MATNQPRQEGKEHASVELARRCINESYQGCEKEGAKEMVVVFEVPGVPVGKGRPRFRSAGKYVQTYTPDKTVVYENFVRQMWLNTGHDKLVGNICATIDAYFPIPKSISKKKHDALVGKPYPKKPDADNIAKAILDALNGIAYDDDSAVVVLTVFKRYGEEPRVEVSLQTED